MVTMREWRRRLAAKRRDVLRIQVFDLVEDARLDLLVQNVASIVDLGAERESRPSRAK